MKAIQPILTQVARLSDATLAEIEAVKRRLLPSDEEILKIIEAPEPTKPEPFWVTIKKL